MGIDETLLTDECEFPRSSRNASANSFISGPQETRFALAVDSSFFFLRRVSDSDIARDRRISELGK